MELALTIISVIAALLTIASDKFLFVTKLVFSTVTGYWLLRIWEPNVYLLELSEYNWNTLINMTESGLLLKSVFLIALSYVFFYWFIRFAIHNTVGKLIDTTVAKRMAQVSVSDKRQMRKFVKAFCKRVVELLYNYRIIKLKDLDIETDFHIYEEYTYKNISLISHSVICWSVLNIYLGIPSYIIISFTVTILFCSILTVSLLEQFQFVFKDLNVAAAKKKSSVTNKSNRAKKGIA